MKLNQRQKNQLRNIKRSREDPLFFVKEIIGAKPYPYQEEVIKAIGKHDKVAWRSGHGVGKTATAAWMTLWFLFTRYPSKVITTATTWRQVTKALWPEIHKWRKQADLELIGDPQYEDLNLMLKVDSDWFATGEASDDPDKIEGFHAPYLFFIVDEGKSVPMQTYEAVEGALATANTKMLVISTPPMQKAGYFYEIFSRKRIGFKTFHTRCQDSPLVSKQWIEERKKEWGEDSPVYKTRVLGEFAESAQDSLIPLAWVESALERKLEPKKDAPIEIGVDVARFGEDKTTFVIRKGGKVLKTESYGGWDTMRTVGNCVKLIREWNPKVVRIDAVGLGGGVIDRLKEQGFEQVIGVNVGEASSDKEKFKNKRAELWWGLRERFQQENISIPDHEELVGQLTNIKHKYTSSGQIQIESKEDMKKRGLSSPDLADAMVLAFAPIKEGKIAWGFA